MKNKLIWLGIVFFFFLFIPIATKADTTFIIVTFIVPGNPAISFVLPTPTNNSNTFNDFLVNTSVIRWENGTITLFYWETNNLTTQIYNKTISIGNLNYNTFWTNLETEKTEINYTMYALLNNTFGNFTTQNITVFTVHWLNYQYGGDVTMTPIMLWIFLGCMIIFLAIAIWTRNPVFFWITAVILIVIAVVLLSQGITVETGLSINSTTAGLVTRTIQATEYEDIKNIYTNGLAIALIMLALFLAIAAFRQKEYI